MLRAASSVVKNEAHRVVWIDHAAASVVDVAAAEGGVTTSPAAPPRHLTAKSPSSGVASRHARRAAKDFFRKVRRELKGAKRILIVGPSTAKLDFLRFIGKRSHAMDSRVVGIETLDDGRDENLVAYAKHYFEQLNAP
jgi:hypothetical protein